MISAHVVSDSINPAGCRLTTIEGVVPKWMLAQLNTHGITRGVAESSRARPTGAILKQVSTHPYKPAQWRYKSPEGGMQPGAVMSDTDAARMDAIEARIRRAVLKGVHEMAAIGAAKEDVNRFMEPWMFVAIVRSATEWTNYLTLRDHGDAQGAHATFARCVREAIEGSTPVLRERCRTLPNQAWHLPYVSGDERMEVYPELLPLMSAARCGRVSYGRQGEARTVEEDVNRALSFVESKHWSPLDQPARAMPDDAWYGPLQGWLSIRKHYAGESGSPAHGCQQDVLPWAVRRASL